MSTSIPGRLQYVRIPLDGGGDLQVNLPAHPIDPAVLVLAADPMKPNPILEALKSTPPARHFELVIRVELDLPESLTCPKCHTTTKNPSDIAEGYCGNCHDWTSPRVTTL